ncbi:MAG TPA: hypothetical protein VIM73_04045, partial [Polyangiaceae bacterium]
MSAIEVVVRPRPAAPPSSALRPLDGLFDVIVDGINITARLGDSQAFTVLVDLAQATSLLSRGTRDRATLPLHSEEEAWEIGLSADGGDVLISVYRMGPLPVVAVHERRVDLVALRTAIGRAIDESRRGELPPGASTALAGARRLLELPWPTALSRPLDRASLPVVSNTPGPLAFSAQATFVRARRMPPNGPNPCVERADLHSLLARGAIAASARGRTVRLPGVYPFLFAERLIALAEEVLDAWRNERALVRRVSLDGAQLRVERGPGDGGLSLTLCGRDANRDLEGVTLVELEAPSFVRAAADFSLALGKVFVEADPAQAKNLRLSALLRAATEMEAAVADATLDDSITNPEPESYRSFGLPRARASQGIWEHGAKMRFVPRWVAAVPGIDLRATFHCGERIVVGSQRETACLESATGRVLWR